MKIKIQTTIKSDISNVWDCWTKPEHIVNWNFASEDWECPSAENDLEVGGKFSFTMAAKDATMKFNFEGIYTQIIENEYIEYVIIDGRQVSINFFRTDEGQVNIVQVFDAEDVNSAELQKSGWQSILNNFKKYVLSQ